MEEHDRLEDANKILVQALELILTGLGLVVLHYLGVPLLIPMVAGLIPYPRLPLTLSKNNPLTRLPVHTLLLPSVAVNTA